MVITDAVRGMTRVPWTLTHVAEIVGNSYIDNTSFLAILANILACRIRQYSTQAVSFIDAGRLQPRSAVKLYIGKMYTNIIM